jgi:hypothetical protein
MGRILMMPHLIGKLKEQQNVKKKVNLTFNEAARKRNKR